MDLRLPSHRWKVLEIVKIHDFDELFMEIIYCHTILIAARNSYFSEDNKCSENMELFRVSIGSLERLFIKSL